MSNPSNYNDQELDFVELKKRMSGALDRFGYKVYSAISFLLRNAVIILILFGLGIGLGILLDVKVKKYNNEMIVIPNFGSVDYLYSKINELDIKIQEKDTAFLNAIGIKNHKAFSGIKIEPIVEVFPLMQRNEFNIEVLRLLAENQDVKKVVEESATSKNYTFHRINFVTKKPIKREQSADIISKFLNSSSYYTQIQKEYLKNLQIKMASNQLTIDRIDGILSMFASYDSSGKGSNMVYYNNQLNDVIVSKEKLVMENGNMRLEMVASDKIIKESSLNLNVEDTESVNGKMKLILPFVFVILFIIIRLLVDFYKKYSKKSQNLA